MRRTEILPIGAVTVETDATAVLRVTMGGDFSDRLPLLDECFRQLREYFAGTRRVFELPFRPAGTTFQTAVWEALQRVPYGETRFYAELAAAVGKPLAARAVGAACKQNPLPLLIPCHRAVGKNGLTGFTFGSGLPLKAQLLRLERENAEKDE